MRWIKQMYDCFHAYKLWFLMLIVTNVLFIFFAWLAYPETFIVLVSLMVIYTLAITLVSLFMIMRRQKIIEATIQDFLFEPNEANEERLCHVSPKTEEVFIRQIGSLIRFYETEHNKQQVELTEYENYIEGWVHEIKKPLSVLTLVLDNRSDEMSPLVRKRMVHIRDQMQGDVEKILYFARLGAIHKDYMFESINVLAFCKHITEDHQTLLDESRFQIQFFGEERKVVSDRKGFAFILSQIITNSTKHVPPTHESPILKFEAVYDKVNDQTILTISDNGPGVPAEDLPFIFDKGFSGGRGTYTKQATGMGLFLVSKMANDLAIQLDAKSEPGSGLSLSLIFPHVK